jgi:hypothetical protein
MYPSGQRTSVKNACVGLGANQREQVREVSMLESLVDLCGFAAAAMTLATFAQRAMLRMRITALFANVFFIVYGWLGPFYPVLILHMILLPVNTVRLREVAKRSGRLTSFDVSTPVPLLEEWRAAR